jgi:cytochrome c553
VNRKTLLLTAVATGALTAAHTAPAGTPEPAAVAPAPGRLSSAACFQCHSAGGFEGITGKSPSEMISELREMRAHRTPEGIMDLVARGLTDAQIAEIAAYLATLPETKEND